MREFFTSGLHIFIIVMIGGFVILSTMALTGKFDHWDSRFIRKAQQIFSRIRRHLNRNRKREVLHQKDNYEDSRHQHHAHHQTHTKDDNIIK
ncbi:hypothetical protein [Mucilaginibacter sp. FT3.2]|uniref:hypothetical protein n=1 Tax=Mucilaginibacter sp. FT3.2 TaxID=2723090 RepID=UPI001621504A|nr:hypothetical protein [Mucilaginibacter sp. FT3.2]MBB6231389.1 hypothetical protein [Mucilaginibacter sp. FT3.2]